MVEISITGFDPLKVELPKVERFVGQVRIVLPALHMQLYDLSLGLAELRGAHIGADGQLFGLDMTLQEPGVTSAKMMELLIAVQDNLEGMWKIAQRELDKKGALL